MSETKPPEQDDKANPTVEDGKVYINPEHSIPKLPKDFVPKCPNCKNLVTRCKCGHEDLEK